MEKSSMTLLTLPISSLSTFVGSYNLRCWLLLYVLLAPAVAVLGQCLSNPEFDEFFATVNGADSIPAQGSCCMKDVCNIPCPQPISSPTIGYGIAVAGAIVVSFVLGVSTLMFVKGEAINYFVAGKTLPLWMVAMTLGAAAVDSNSLLGNVDLSYKYALWDGLAIPVGLGLSLWINGLILAPKLNEETNVLTLVDVLAKRYGKIVEVLCSCCCITSFLMLLAGNLVGMGFVTSYVWGTTQSLGIWVAAMLIWAFTVSGGLFSVAYTDVVLGAIGWPGCIVCAFWLISNTPQPAPSTSIGFPGYVYPNEDVCAMYEGVPCTNDSTKCCYNETKWCPSEDNCRIDNGAYPFGDKSAYPGQMTDAYAVSPFPNAILWNWATIFILAFGNLGALDFQVRCMAGVNPKAARWGCFIGGLFTFFVGIPFAFLGGITRFYYGPDSPYAEYDVDTCSTLLGLPTCGAWLPDSEAFVKLVTHQVPPFVGGWCLIGICAASMSTANGAILAMGTVASHNLLRQLDGKWPDLVTPKTLLSMARLSTIPFTIISAMIASLYKETGYLLIVAFDIVLASVVPSLVACFYVTNPSPRAALCSVLTGIITRVTLEFALPKDGTFILPYSGGEFLNYGVAASTGLPVFVDGAEGEVWDPSTEQCEQEQYKDFTGVDSLSSFLLSIIVLLSVTFLERKIGHPLFNLPGLVGYEKELDDKDDSKLEDITHKTRKIESDEPSPDLSEGGDAADQDGKANVDEA